MNAVIFNFNAKQLVCRMCGWVANNVKMFEEFRIRRQDKLEIDRKTFDRQKEQLGFRTQFEFEVYEELQSVGIDKEKSREIAKLIFEKLRKEIKVIGWKTKRDSQKRIVIIIYAVLKVNELSKDKMDELVPKIIDWAGLLLEDAFGHISCIQCKSQTVIFDYLLDKFVCSLCGWITIDDYFPRYDFSESDKKITMRKQDHKCASCRRTLGIVEWHHKDGNRSNNHISNCQALCPDCHADWIHRRLKP